MAWYGQAAADLFVLTMMSRHGIPARGQFRKISRKIRFNRFRSTACPIFLDAVIPRRCRPESFGR